MVALRSWREGLSSPGPLVMTAIAALVVGVAGAKVAIDQGPRLKAESVPVVVPAPVLRSVTVLGRLEPWGEIVNVSAPNTGDGSRVEKLLVAEGDSIQAGQVIAMLNSQQRLQAALQQAQEQVRVAQAQLAQVQAGAKSGELLAQEAEIARLRAERVGDLNTQSAVVARLQAELAGVLQTQRSTQARLQLEYETAQAEADRYERLFQEQVVSESERDAKRLTAKTALRRREENLSDLQRLRNTLTQQITEAKAALARSQAARSQQVEAAQATLARLAEVRPVDVQAAQAAVGQARAAVAKAEADLEQAYVRSPQRGTVLQIHTRAGEKIAADGIVDVGQTDRMVAIVEVYESDVQRLRLGQMAQIEASAIAGELRGTVAVIGRKVLRQTVVNTDPTANTDARVVEVRIELEPASSRRAALFTNAQVTAKIFTGKSFTDKSFTGS